MSEGEIKKVNRTTKACDQCSRFRRKCVGGLPCLLCVERQRTCSYSKKTKKRGPERQDLAKRALVILEDQKSKSIKVWTRSDFLNTTVTDSKGQSGSILDMYFSFAHQHNPMFSKMWISQNIQDVPMHVLHVIYMLVLKNTKQVVPNGDCLAKRHAKFVERVVWDRIEDFDPFLVSTLINLTACCAQILGLDRDVDLLWRSSASNRLLGNEIGMDKQFLRSLWFLLYQWDHHNILVYHDPMMIDTVISDSTITSYISPNNGDPSNIPLNFLTHCKYSLTLHSIGKQIIMVDSNRDRVELLLRLDQFYETIPISFLPQSIFLGRTINWINELYHFSKFCLLIPLYLGDVNKGFVVKQFEQSVDAMVCLAQGFITFSNNVKSTDQTFLFFSKTLFIAVLGHCLISQVDLVKVGIIVRAIKLTGYQQDYDLVWDAVVDVDKARSAVVGLL